MVCCNIQALIIRLGFRYRWYFFEDNLRNSFDRFSDNCVTHLGDVGRLSDTDAWGSR